MMTKQALRKYFRDRRHHLSSFLRQQAAQQLLDIVLQHRLLDEKQFIACYLSQDNELNLTPLIDYLWQQNKAVYLPVIAQERLVFKLYRKDTRMHVGPYGILEPETIETISHDQLDLVFVPLVAFDQSGNRLGMGKGFYDKTFQDQRSVLMGVAYACQEAENLPVDCWDVPLSGVITEAEFIQI